MQHKEKELRQRELMQMMSVPLTAIECSWFISLNLFFLPSSLFLSLASAQLFSNSSILMLFFFWECVFLSTTAFAQVIAAFASKSSRATLAGVLLYFIGYFLSVFIDYTTFNRSIILLLSVHPVVAIGFGLQTIGSLEDTGVGIISSTYSFSDSTSGYSFATCINSLLLDTVILIIVSMYLNRIVQGDYGRANPLYFPFTKNFWCPRSGSINVHHKNDNEQSNKHKGVTIEPVSDALREQEQDGRSVNLYNLTKRFGKKTAVDRLSLSMYSGQVTALLGHNGAGKVR